MDQPIVFISHFRVNEGKLDEFMQQSQKVTEAIKADKPGTVAFLKYLNEERTELSIVHVFPDADSFDQHVEGAQERAKSAFEYIQPTRREVYGMPSDRVQEMLKPPEESEISYQNMPQTLDGYIRTPQE